MNNCWWLEILMWIIKMIVSFIGICLVFLLIMCVPHTEYHYDYIDLDNIKGTAKECSYEFDTVFSGGQGSPVCELSDGTIKQVKEYKYVYERTIAPITDLLKILGGKE